MNYQYHGKTMDRAPPQGSVARARERAEAGLRGNAMAPSQIAQDSVKTNNSTPSPPWTPSPVTPTAKITKPRPAMDGRNGQSISRPTRVPQWPLPGPIVSPTSAKESQPYRPPPGMPQQAPQRPPRPSRIPSILDQSRLQDPTPSFLTTHAPSASPQQEGSLAQPPPFKGLATSRETSSSVGSIPDFPGIGPMRKSSAMGPPPSNRRGASSYYSAASYVSPIPEERTRPRSRGSFASSAAMPDGWSAGSPVVSPAYAEAFYDETMNDRLRQAGYEGNREEVTSTRNVPKEVREGPIGHSNYTTNRDSMVPKPLAPTHATNPFEGGTGFVELTTNSSKLGALSRSTAITSTESANADRTSPDALLKAYAAASSEDTVESRGIAPPPRPFARLSAIRRPPRLDIDAVRAAEARGSMTSLPDLIRRATKLAAMIDKGRRPTSRLDDLNAHLYEKEASRDMPWDRRAHNRHPSGLSDMLAAFPPPVHPLRNEQHSGSSGLRNDTYPTATGPNQEKISASLSEAEYVKKQPRRCCGLPPWAFLLVTFLVLCAIVAAIVVPLEFFVFKNLGNDKNEATDCAASLECKNGGTSLMTQGACSCICTNGFTGPDCGSGGSVGCTMTNLVSTDDSASIDNVTLGQAIPRLIADAKANFSIPLSGTTILAKINSADLSCIAQNSLVTFNGHSARLNRARVQGSSDQVLKAGVSEELFVSVSAITVSVATAVPTPAEKIVYAAESPGIRASATSTTTSSTASPSKPSQASRTGSFEITEEVLDFSRVAILFILQEIGIDSAETAQGNLQRFFATAGRGRDQASDEVSNSEAATLKVGGGIEMNLVDFRLKLSGNTAFGRASKRSEIFAFAERGDANPCRARYYFF